MTRFGGAAVPSGSALFADFFCDKSSRKSHGAMVRAIFQASPAQGTPALLRAGSPILLIKTASGTTLITHGQLIDGTGRAPIPDASILISEGLIAYAGAAADAPEPPAG